MIAAMAKIRDLASLMRPRQWYKNILVFLALFFVGKLSDVNAFLLTLAGFFSLCFISSSNYILNDIVDRKKDALHPEKRLRPLAAGRVKLWQAGGLAAFLFFLSLLIAFQLSSFFFMAVLALFFLTQLYTFFLKQEVFADILAIAVNFVIRSISGALIINVTISPWLILCPFFLAIFLAVGKRHADVILLGKDAEKNRTVLRYYTKEITQPLLIIATTAFILSYALYSFQSNHNLLFTLPFALYVIFRYFSFIMGGSAIARSTERAVKDWKMMLGIFLWAVTVFLIIYF